MFDIQDERFIVKCNGDICEKLGFIIPHGAVKDPEFVKMVQEAETINDIRRLIDNWRNI